MTNPDITEEHLSCPLCGIRCPASLSLSTLALGEGMRASCIQEGIKQERDKLIELVRLRQLDVICGTCDRKDPCGSVGVSTG